jgi:hypothetical protein
MPQYAISTGINGAFSYFLKGIVSPHFAYAVKSVLFVHAQMA